MSGYAFHPDAFADLDEICEYIAENNVDAADRVPADIHSTLITARGITTDRTSTPGPDYAGEPIRNEWALRICVTVNAAA